MPLPEPEDHKVFKNDKMPRAVIDCDALYCERCLMDEKPVLSPVKDLKRDYWNDPYECPKHGNLGDRPAVIQGKALAGVILIFMAPP